MVMVPYYPLGQPQTQGLISGPDRPHTCSEREGGLGTQIRPWVQGPRCSMQARLI